MKTLRVEHSQVTKHKGNQSFNIEASELGLKPGQTPPERIATDIGSGEDFTHLFTSNDPDGTPTMWIYMQAIKGIVLRIFND